MPVVTRGPLLTLYWKLHRTLFRLSSGRIGARSGDWPVLLLTTKGEKTGERRDVALNYLRDDGSYVVIGSFAGADRHPAWWKNLRAHPEAEIMVDGKRIRVRAVECLGARRQLLWSKIVERDPAYREYQDRTKREIPVVALEPLGEAAG